MNYTYLKTPIGELLIVGENGTVTEIVFPDRGKRGVPQPGWKKSRAGLEDAVVQLREYFAGRRSDFDLDLHLPGTKFQRRVWEELTRIPYGDTISYGELARRVGNPKASRAVGAANGKNPIPIVVPCHRVIGANGKLTGFGGGLPVRKHYWSWRGVRWDERADLRAVLVPF